MDLLTTISRKTNVKEMLALYPGPVSDFIRESFPHLEEHDPEYSRELNSHLRDPLKYLIYKLSLNKMGVSRDRVKKLFGDHGLRELDTLLDLEVVARKHNRYFFAGKSFTINFDGFVEQFRAVASFIKPYKVVERKPLNPLFVNASESVSAETYEKIAKIQRETFQKIREVVQEDKDGGPIPMFYICALDTLDVESALEIAKRGETQL